MILLKVPTQYYSIWFKSLLNKPIYMVNNWYYKVTLYYKLKLVYIKQQGTRELKII